MVQFSGARLNVSFAALSDATRRGVLEQLGRADASITGPCPEVPPDPHGHEEARRRPRAGRARRHGEGRARADLQAGPAPAGARDGLDRGVPPALGLTLRRVGRGCRGTETEGEGQWTQEARVITAR